MESEPASPALPFAERASAERASPGSAPHESAPLPRLTRLQFWSFFAIVLAIFLFSTGPVWRHPWQIETLDLAIFASYAPIPILVAAGLAYKKRLGIKAFFLDTLELVLLKYTVTFGLALVFWGVTPAPIRLPFHVPQPAPLPAESAAPPTPIKPAETGTIHGKVTAEDGKPAAGALVFVSSGLESYVFSPVEQPIELVHDGTGIVPRLSVAQRSQPIFVRGTDEHLHTFVAVAGGRTMINVPILRTGEKSRVSFAEAQGVMSLRCSVHQQSPSEQASTLVVLAHPFSAFTADDGTFRLDGVPAGDLQVTAIDAGRATGQSTLRLARQGEVELSIPLHRAP